MSTQNLCFNKIRKIMYTPVNPSFTIQKWGLRGTKFYRRDVVTKAEQTSVQFRSRPKQRSVYNTANALGFMFLILVFNVLF